MAEGTITLPGGETVSSLGLGTWMMGESAASFPDEVRALRAGIDAGLTVIDTAEMYASGGAERVVAEAIRNPPQKLFIVSKVLPSNASHAGTLKACHASLKRLGLACIDLYLLHWRGGTPLRETVRAFEELKAEGKIRHWGVSNFDVSDMEELFSVPSGNNCAANQVQYSLSSRGVEFDLLPWQQEHGIPLMAYCPLGQGELLTHKALQPLAEKHRVTAAAIALAFLLSRNQVQPIPKTSKPARIAEIAKARTIALDADDLKLLDSAFPPPRRKQSLAMT
jgi:diketogulonate reductase-like aldo/keto reductase